MTAPSVYPTSPVRARKEPREKTNKRREEGGKNYFCFVGKKNRWKQPKSRVTLCGMRPPPWRQSGCFVSFVNPKNFLPSLTIPIQRAKRWKFNCNDEFVALCVMSWIARLFCFYSSLRLPFGKWFRRIYFMRDRKTREPQSSSTIPKRIMTTANLPLIEPNERCGAKVDKNVNGIENASAEWVITRKFSGLAPREWRAAWVTELKWWSVIGLWHV